jgi:SanA protein
VLTAKSKLKRRCALLWGAFSLCAIFLITTAAINSYILHGSKGRIFYRIEDVPTNAVGLVLGTDLKRADGSTNIHFLNRTTAAARIYASGKVKRLIISGNPNNRGFNEVLEMQKVLLENGVPEMAMTLDMGGLRTLDSVRAAAKVQRLTTVTVITDGFHAPRSIFLCRHFGIDAVAFCGGREPSSYWLFRVEVREYLARVKALLDVSMD